MRKHMTILGFLFLLSAISTADPVRKQLNQAGESKDYPGSNVLVVFDSTRTEVQETGLTYVWNHTVYKVLTIAGAKELNTIVFGYDPQSAFVEIKRAVIYRKSGTVESVDLTRVLDYPAPARAIYWGAREIMVEIGRLEPGDGVEVLMFRKGFTYALLFGEEDDRYIPPMRGHFYDIVDFFGPNPINIKVYQVIVPADKLLQFEFYNGEAQVSAWRNGGNMVYTFSKGKILPLKTESRMVAQSDVAPKLLLSTSPDWYAKSTWFFGVNEDYGSFASTPDISAKVREILQPARSESDSISLLTHWCADEIRYSGISMGEGEGFTLHTGDMTFTDRCGVCKDKAGMLITLLRAAGFESYPAMTMAGSRIDYIPADQFNHCVTVVKRRNGEYQLLDPTWVPFLRELWSSAEQQQQYLMGLPEGADLGTTPISAPENHYIHYLAETILEADGTLKGTMFVTAEGQSDGSLRRYFGGAGPDDWKQAVEREFLRIHPLATITSLTYSDPRNYLAGPMEVTIGFTIPRYATVAGNTVFVIPLLARNPFQGMQSHLYFELEPEIRTYPFRDRCSREVTIRETMSLPEGFQMVRMPEAIVSVDPAASITGNYRLDGNVLIFSEEISLEKRIYEAAEWAPFRAVVKHQNRYAGEPVILTLMNDK